MDNRELCFASCRDYSCNLAGVCQEKSELQTLRAKVASAEVLVEALTMLLTTREYKEVNGKDYVYDAMRITAWDMAQKALATYDKLSEVKHDTK